MANLKTVILAGGFGTRLGEETGKHPKPMIEVGGRPILWHIMNIYAHYDVSDFYLALGYKSESIKEYFLKFHQLSNDLTINLRSGNIDIHNQEATPAWNVHLINTGINSMTGGRIKRLQNHIGSETFMLTYGDGVANINIDQLYDFHKSHGKLATVTAVRPTARFGDMEIAGNKVQTFSEKPQTGEGWINGGFFILEPGIFDYIKNDESIWEKDPLEAIAKDGELMAYHHEGFWQCMDTMREKLLLEALWKNQEAPWKVW